MVAVICKKCRIHAVVHIDFAYASNPCPNSQYPLHHFQRLHAEDRATSDSIDYAWQCSASECGAHLKITFRMPRLSPQQKDILTDTELLRRRYEAIVGMDPNRDGVRQATPMDSLARLRKYVKDALDPKHSKRTFPANNKRFMEAFGMHGRDCADILTRFGFKHAVRLDTRCMGWQKTLTEDAGRGRLRVRAVDATAARCLGRPVTCRRLPPPRDPRRRGVRAGSVDG